MDPGRRGREKVAPFLRRLSLPCPRSDWDLLKHSSRSPSLARSLSRSQGFSPALREKMEMPSPRPCFPWAWREPEKEREFLRLFYLVARRAAGGGMETGREIVSTARCKWQLQPGCLICTCVFTIRVGPFRPFVVKHGTQSLALVALVRGSSSYSEWTEGMRLIWEGSKAERG